MIRIADEPRSLEPIVDPWVEEYEAESRRPAASRVETPEAQADLYIDRAPRRAEPTVERTPERAPERGYDDRNDHRRSGWSLFGRGKRNDPQASYPSAPAPSRNEMRMGSTAAQPAPQPESRAMDDDDLEIPSFLRRLAN